MIGLYGPVFFGTFGGAVQNFEDMKKTVSARWSPHEIFQGKPLLEYGGASLIELEFKMNFIKPITTDPTLAIFLLQETMDLALPYPLFLGPFPVGRGSSLFVMESLEVSPKYFFQGGSIMGAEVQVKLKEYPDTFSISNLLKALGGLGASIPGVGGAVSAATGAVSSLSGAVSAIPGVGTITSDVVAGSLPVSMVNAEAASTATSVLSRGVGQSIAGA